MNPLVRHLAVAAFAASLAVAGSQAALATHEPGHTSDKHPETDAKNAAAPDTKTVLGKLHHSNQREIEMGKLAKENGHSQEVKAYGDTLVSDHTAADEKVAALARKKDIDLAAATPPMENVKDHVQPGADFDKKFSKMMVDDHKKNIDEVKSARDQTSDQDLKTLLTELLPTLEKHRDTAEKLAGS